MASPRMRKEEMKSEKKKEKKETKKKERKKVEHRKRKWWEKCEELTISLPMMRMKRKVSRRRKAKEVKSRPKARQTLGKSGRWLFLFCFWIRIGCVCQRCDGRSAEKRRTEVVERMQQKCRKEDGWRRFHKGGGSQKEKTGLK